MKTEITYRYKNRTYHRIINCLNPVNAGAVMMLDIPLSVRPDYRILSIKGYSSYATPRWVIYGAQNLNKVSKAE